MSVRDCIKDIVEACKWDAERIVWLSGGFSTQRSRVLHDLAEDEGFSHLNIGVEVTSRLLDVAPRKRPVRVRSLLRRLLDDVEKQRTELVIAVDHIEVLFDPSLQLDVPGLLRNEAANRTLVVSWPGTIIDTDATYASMPHPEHVTFSVRPTRVVYVHSRS